MDRDPEPAGQRGTEKLANGSAKRPPRSRRRGSESPWGGTGETTVSCRRQNWGTGSFAPRALGQNKGPLRSKKTAKGLSLPPRAWKLVNKTYQNLARGKVILQIGGGPNRPTRYGCEHRWRWGRTTGEFLFTTLFFPRGGRKTFGQGGKDPLLESGGAGRD